MRRRTISIIIFILVLSGSLLYRYVTYPYRFTPQDIKPVYTVGETADIDAYADQCKEEIAGKIEFPAEQVSKAVICSGFFSWDKILSDSNTRQLLRVLNDTASYEWGEVGTFISDKKIVFFDSNSTAIGITELEKEGRHQSYSYPYLRRTKWGHLTQKAFDQVAVLISQ